MLLAFVVFLAGCTQQQEQTDVQIPGHPVVYSFSNPIKEALKYPVTEKDEIRTMILSSRNMNVIFDGSSAEDNKYFQVVLYNIVTKIQTFFVYEGVLMRFNTYYFIGDKWYNSTDETERPDLSGLTLWIKGPDTGATGNSVSFADNTIFVQGMNYKNLTLAGDRLVLLVIGVEKI